MAGSDDTADTALPDQPGPDAASNLTYVTVLHDHIVSGVVVPRHPDRFTERRLTSRPAFPGSPADAELGSIGVGRQHLAVLRCDRCGWIRDGGF